MELIWILLLALRACLEPDTHTVYRGVSKNLADMYLTGTNVTWPAFSSCTTSMEVSYFHGDHQHISYDFILYF